jgi:hypothetical protein
MMVGVFVVTMIERGKYAASAHSLRTALALQHSVHCDRGSTFKPESVRGDGLPMPPRVRGRVVVVALR